MSGGGRTQPLRVASYNIHRCVGSDGAWDPGRIVGVLRELDAAVVALQEVGTHPHAPGDADPFEMLGAAAGMAAIPGPTLESARGRFGNAVLTRLPVRAARRVDLTVRGREPRGAIAVDVEAGGALLRVVGTHLGLVHRERLEQATRLLHALHALGSCEGRGLVVLGDINEWRPWGRVLRRLEARLGRSPAVRTFPARRPLLALDRVWAGGAAALVSVRAHVSPLAQRASDHLPVVASLRVG